jgi:hypothetical protein
MDAAHQGAALLAHGRPPDPGKRMQLLHGRQTGRGADWVLLLEAVDFGSYLAPVRDPIHRFGSWIWLLLLESAL